MALVRIRWVWKWERMVEKWNDENNARKLVYRNEIGRKFRKNCCENEMMKVKQGNRLCKKN